MIRGETKVVLTGLGILGAVLTGAIAAYMMLEHMNWMDALWLAISAVSTVGFADVLPATLTGRLLTLGLIIVGTGLFAYVLTRIMVHVADGYFSSLWGLSMMQKEISDLKDHVVVCGAGRVGQEVIRYLAACGVPFVVVDIDETIVEDLRQQSLLALTGNATEDSRLEEAQLAMAKAVVICLPDDGANLLATVTCKTINPRVRVIARANSPKSEPKLKLVGADDVISPAAIGGCRMALSAVKPSSAAFAESFMDSQTDLDIEELLLPCNSNYNGKTLRELDLIESFGVQVLVIRRNDQLMVNPRAEEILQAGDTMVVFGPKQGLVKFEAAGSISFPDGLS